MYCTWVNTYLFTIGVIGKHIAANRLLAYLHVVTCINHETLLSSVVETSA